jgi:hypothetical protein
MKSRDNDTKKDEDRCSACPGEDDELVIRPLTGYDLYLFHKKIVDKEAELG